MSRVEGVCGILANLINADNRCMEKGYRTLKDIEAKTKGVGYQKINRACNALVEAELVHPWRGVHNERRLSLDDALRVERFISFSSNGQTLKTAIGQLRSTILEEENEKLRRENERLRALVEVTPNPWWMRLFRWMRIVRVRASNAATTLHH